jgi:FtsP/CotA-like multicopper oxidase with cupredoxin domain/plastocyanin
MTVRRWAIAWGIVLGSLAVVLGPQVWTGRLAQAREATEPAEPHVEEVDLTAAPVRWEIQPGLVIDGWGYNGQVPGPELRVRQGDVLRVHLHNRLPAPTTLHWHGVDVPLDMDGVPGLSQNPVQPGEDFTYEFVANNPGTRWYHSHVDSNSQLELGLYGALIIEPRQPEPVTYDHEFTYLLDEKALDFTPEVALGQAKLDHAEAGNGRGGLPQYDLFLINGKAGDAIPPLWTAAGEHIRLRLINAGNLVHAMHLHGHSFRIVATDGNPVPDAQHLLKDTVLIGPGERYDLAIEGTNPGIWMFHCHMPNHQDNGMMAVLVYSGFQPPANANHVASVVPVAQHTAPVPAFAPTAVPMRSVSSAEARGPQADLVTLRDNRYQPASLTVPLGTRVTWANDGLNLHTISALDSTFDSGALAPGERWMYTFTAPGQFRYICRQHVLTGMVGTITVR